jgi:transcriptional regulator
MSTPFAPREPADMAALIDQYPLAWIVSAGPEGQEATVLPLLAETDEAGDVRALFGHFARANPQVALLERQPQALILFQGPQGYVAPRLVSKPHWGPTWNYAVIRFDVDVHFVPEETDAALERLAAHLERDRPDPWTVDRMGARYAQLARYIIPFRASVREAHPRFKLGQDEAPATFDEIVHGLENRALAEWMMRTVRG